MALLIERHPWVRPGVYTAPCIAGGTVRALCLGRLTLSHFRGQLTTILDAWADHNDAELERRIAQWRAAETAGRAVPRFPFPTHTGRPRP